MTSTMINFDYDDDDKDEFDGDGEDSSPIKVGEILPCDVCY